MHSNILSKIRGLLKTLPTGLRTLVILSLVFATVANVAFSPYISRAIPVGEMSPTEQAKSWLYFNAFSTCVDKVAVTGSFWEGEMSPEGVSQGKWFNTGVTTPSIGYAIGSMGVQVDGFPAEDSAAKVECGGSNIKWIGDALKLWGYTSNIEAWCDLTGDLHRKDGAICTGSSSNDGWESGDATRALRENFKRAVQQKVYGGGAPTRSDAAAYAHAQAAFFGGCLRDPSPAPYTGGQSGDTIYRNVTVVNTADGTKSQVTYAGVKKQSDSIPYSVSPNGNNISDTCGNLVRQMEAYSTAYALVIQQRIAENKQGDTNTNTCAAGADCGDEGTTSCAVEGVGWIVCPITEFMALVSDSAFDAISEFLTVNTDLYNNTDTQSGTYAAWSAFRNIANVAFAVLFIIVIYSQLTGMGVSNYGIKKTLPRMVVAAIFVNLSFFVCQLAIDASQILGSAINGFLQNVPVGGNTSIDQWEDVFGKVLAGTALVAGAATAVAATILALSISLPLVLAFLAAVLMTIIILVGREAAIVILIVLSPLAFVAYLLPNTEKWFKKWYQIFGALLMVFPIIALLYGGGALTAKIIANAANTGDDGLGQFALNLTALAVSAVPLLATPALLKGAMNSAPVIGKMASNWQSRANSNLGKKLNEGYRNSAWGRGRAVRKNARQNYKDRKFAQNVVDGGVSGRVAGVAAGGAGLTKSQKYAQQSLERSAISVADKARSEDINTAAALMLEQHSDPATQIGAVAGELSSAIEKGDTTKARAAQSILLNSGGAGLDTLHKTLSTSMATPKTRNSTTGVSLRNALNGAGLKGKDNALAKWAYTQDGQDASGAPIDTSIDAVESEAGTYSGLSSTELGGQRLRVLESAMKANPKAITADQAKAVLDSPNVIKDMDLSKRTFFEKIANTSGVGGTPTGTGTAIPGQTAAQRARQTAQQAAQGSAGTTPFVVNSAGVTTQGSAGNPVLTIPHNPPAATPAAATPTTPSTPAQPAPQAPPTGPATATPPTDSAGRQTPPTVANPDDYHDGMTR